jgi:hypothetical protein
MALVFTVVFFASMLSRIQCITTIRSGMGLEKDGRSVQLLMTVEFSHQSPPIAGPKLGIPFSKYYSSRYRNRFQRGGFYCTDRHRQSKISL